MRVIRVLLLMTCLWPVIVRAGLEVFACEPEWAALASELGGDQVQVSSAVTGLQDVHYIQARPSLISRVRKADLMICTGADLEAGWLPVLLRQGNNPRVLPGKSGFLEASSFVDMLEKPQVLDRAAGDIHPYGNPHVQMDPRNIALVAAGLNRRLQELDPGHASYFQQRHDDFQARWANSLATWERELAPFKGSQLVTHHRSWVYLFAWSGLVEAGSLEPKPGVPPSSSYLSELLTSLQGKNILAIVRSSYQSSRPSDWLSHRTDIPAIVLPHTVGSVEGADDLFGVFDQLVARLKEAAQ